MYKLFLYNEQINTILERAENFKKLYRKAEYADYAAKVKFINSMRVLSSIDYENDGED